MNIFLIYTKNILLFITIYVLPGYLFLQITLRNVLKKIEIIILSIPLSLTILSLLIFFQHFLLNKHISQNLLITTSMLTLIIEAMILLIKKYKNSKLH